MFLILELLIVDIMLRFVFEFIVLIEFECIGILLIMYNGELLVLKDFILWIFKEEEVFGWFDDELNCISGVLFCSKFLNEIVGIFFILLVFIVEVDFVYVDFLKVL